MPVTTCLTSAGGEKLFKFYLEEILHKKENTWFQGFTLVTGLSWFFHRTRYYMHTPNCRYLIPTLGMVPHPDNLGQLDAVLYHRYLKPCLTVTPQLLNIGVRLL